MATIEKIKSLKPLSFLMDYCCFNFSKFDQGVQVHSLDKFLEYVNNFIVKNFEIFCMDIANDIIRGEWLSVLRRCSVNRKVPGLNPTRRSAGLKDPTSPRGFR